jgi:uncharacterized phage infection (PIP) family protein YhgE
MSKLDDSEIKRIADKVCEETALTFAEFMSNIKEGLTGIASDVSSINERLTRNEEKISLEATQINEISDYLKVRKEIIDNHEERLNKGKDLIKEIRTDFDEYKQNSERIAKIIPTLETIQKTYNSWTWKSHKLKIIGIIFGILFILACFIAGINLIQHAKKWGVTFQDGNKNTKLEQIYDNIQEGKVNETVRGGTIHHMTDAELDSLEAEQLRMIKPISGLRHN